MTRTVSRIYQIDALRGIALILMALDHAGVFSGSKFIAEYYGGHARIGTFPYWITGLVTNIAAPTFWLLSGVSIALLVQGRLAKGESEWAVTRFLLIRATVLIFLDIMVVELFWPQTFNILASLGVSVALMSVLRFLPGNLLLVFMMGLFFGYPWIWGKLVTQAIQSDNILFTMWITYARETDVEVIFPILGWISLMGLGFVMGQHLRREKFTRPIIWFIIGVGLIAVWFLMRSYRGYGNFILVPNSLEYEWSYFLFMHKGPPSTVYLLFNLGIAFCLISLLYKNHNISNSFPLKWTIIVGQASLFFYITHLFVYYVLGKVMKFYLPVGEFPGFLRGYFVWLIGLLLLIPISKNYRVMRKRHAQSILQYL